MPKKISIHLGHSPDSDDAFMFYALTKNKIDTGNFNFIHVIEDIESLNKRALKKELEVSAISVHSYSLIHNYYSLLNSGASVGKNYGPIIVSKKPITLKKLSQSTIGIPGKLTTAYLTLKLCIGNNFNEKIIKFDKIINAIQNDKIDAGLIIHEEQLLYKKNNLYKIIDLGEWWYKNNNLPLPLGVNIIRRNLGKDKINKINKILKNSIEYALNNKKEALFYALQYARNMNVKIAENFIDMYVNNYTLNFKNDAKKAINLLFKKAYDNNIIKKIILI